MKFHLIVDEYNVETLSHDETKKIRKLLKGGNFVSKIILILAQSLTKKGQQK